MIKRIFGGLLFWLLFAFIGLFIIAILVGWSTGIGWIVTKLLPFTLFEATLLVMLSSLVAGYLVYRLMNLPNELDDLPDFDDFSPESLTTMDDGIPPERLATPDTEDSDEHWFRYQIANEIYDDLQDDLNLAKSMGDAQIKELAIRLTDVVTAVFQSRAPKPRSKRVSVTIAQLRKQMNKMKLRPYDDDILETAVSAVNIRLSYDEELADIVRYQTWDELA
jgi:hypothetical protein